MNKTTEDFNKPCKSVKNPKKRTPRVSTEKTLAYVKPEIAKLWDYEKNGDLTPELLSAYSRFKVWWKCDKCGNEWEAFIHNMSNGTYHCQQCRNISKSILIAYPDIAKEWNYEKNIGLSPDSVFPSSYANVWWECNDCGYEWEAGIHSRVLGNRPCPRCDKNSFANRCPELKPEWNTQKNKDLTPYDVSYGSGKKVWWMCKGCGHEWQSTVRNRSIIHSQCPMCQQKRHLPPVSEVSLLYEEWHPTKNKGIFPDIITCGSSKKVWWMCKKCGREWEATVNSKYNNLSNCSGCERVRINSSVG